MSSESNPYETEKLLSEYLLFHYGLPEEILPWPFGPTAALEYPARCAEECIREQASAANLRALDLGCAVGRATFELARHCQEVIGIDYSKTFVTAAESLRTQNTLPYSYLVEGDIRKSTTAHIPAGVDAARVRFEQGDAHQLRGDIGTFDIVLMANLLDRLHTPSRCLAQLPSLIRPGGRLVITTPCTWLEEYTPKDQWLGGRNDVVTLDSLKKILSPAFSLMRTGDLPFLIREHARKFQWSVAQLSVWERKTS